MFFECIFYYISMCKTIILLRMYVIINSQHFFHKTKKNVSINSEDKRSVALWITLAVDNTRLPKRLFLFLIAAFS